MNYALHPDWSGLAAEPTPPTMAARLAASREQSLRFPGLMEASRQLGVHRNHLYLVLAGHRTSHSLKRRYNELKGASR